jgi:hypothetical protein
MARPATGGAKETRAAGTEKHGRGRSVDGGEERRVRSI